MAVGVYLIVLAAAVFAAWLLRVAIRRRPDIIGAGPLPPPGAPYRSVVHVDPAVFADDTAAKMVAKRAFESWVRDLPRAPSHAIDLVRSIDLQSRHVARLTTELEGRRVVECCEPISSREVPHASRYSRNAIDPWNPPDDLPRASRFIATCWTCGATGRITCTSCDGTARRPCASCDGAGRYYGQAANGARRMLNCKSCRGKGNVACADCSRGKVPCTTCRQAKKLACWFEIRSDLRQDVQLAPDAVTLQAFSWAQRGASITEDQLARDAHVVDRIAKLRPLTVEDLSTTVTPAWRGEHASRLQARVDPGERIRSQTLTFLAVPSASVTYSVLGEQHTLVLEGLRMLAPPTDSPAAEPFLRRSRMLRRLTLALAALPIAAAALYGARGEYFTAGRAAGLAAGVVAAALATAVLAYAALWNSTLGRRRARTWAITTIAPMALATILVALAEPSTTRARDLITSGQLEEASAELRALKLPADHTTWADLHLRRSLAAATCSEATVHLRHIRSDLPQRVDAQNRADTLAVVEADAALQARDADAASTALACSSEPGRATPAARTLRAQVAGLQSRQCLARKDWRCAIDHAASAGDPRALQQTILAAIRAEADARAAAAARTQRLEDRVEEAQAALALWQSYLLDSHTLDLPGPVLDLRAALARDQSALAKQQRIAQVRAEAEARRQAAVAARERQRAELAAERERRRQAAEEARENSSSRPLLCNDGTLSPTCTCGGSRRGCCSWHGGVAGCS
jgi:hypothetical protein